MREFDRQVVLRLVNHEAEVASTYLAECAANGGDADRALSIVFLVYVVGNKRLEEKYESLFDEPESNERPISFIPDAPVVSRIRALVNEVGWREFAWGLAVFAAKKADQMRVQGLTSEVDGWLAIAKKVHSLRKNVQL